MDADGFEKLVHRAAAALDIQAAPVDPDGGAVLVLPDGAAALLMRPDPADAIALLYAEVGAPVDPLPLFRRALVETSLWHMGPDATLGVVEATGELTVSVRIDFAEDAEQAIAAGLRRFAELVAHWRAEVDASEIDDADAAPAAPVMRA